MSPLPTLSHAEARTVTHSALARGLKRALKSGQVVRDPLRHLQVLDLGPESRAGSEVLH